ncbi:DUF882 domain-containing protein [Brucella sp. 10RB9214]|uniref:DUF882 domain-containing protein n=1 Tax=unclassified Brucella TaxID=2632610 RepID=UPI0012AEADCC|nr:MULTISPECIES: DUF882 domain-containing protein [unclassified Brucella]MRN46562.1 DUF882 domain-containing protein [Brucella sp. 10RB9212]MRN50613.1 DUF882 domain-containing protein [Brucella sp. 10RB9214]
MKKCFSKVWTGACSGVMRARASVSAGLAIAAVAMVVLPSQASAETRSLKLYYVHTGEKAEIAFKKDGRFLPDGLKRLNVFLRDWRRNEPTRMDPRLFDLIWQVYQSTGSREYITVVSAYRSPATNAMLRSSTRGVAKKSQHMLGRAMDYFIPGVPLAKLRAIGMRYQIGGVGYYPRSGSPFVHMDVGNVRHWPRMSRRELLALFPDGKTVHIPTDGKPLPGYEQALAMIEKRKAGGGTIMMASNSSSRKRKSLFAALFGGGGADEEEDNGDTAAPATARPARATAPTRQAPAAVPAAPVEQPRETMVAALPARDAPVPMQAPRPEAGLDAQAAAAETPVAAFNVPVPAHKPQMAPQDAVALAAAEDPAAAARAAVDANTAQVADAGMSAALTNGFVPVPSARPHLETDNVQLAAAVIPTARPERPGEHPARGQDAIAALVNSQPDEPAQMAGEMADATGNAVAPQPGKTAAFPLPTQAPRADTKLAMVSRRDEIGELIAPPEDDYDYDAKPVAAAAPKQAPAPVQMASAARTAPTKPTAVASAAMRKKAAIIGKTADTGVRTTTKGARHMAKAPSRPRPVIRPAVMPSSEIAMSTEPVSNTVPVTSPVLRNDALRSAPTMVYTAGFQRGDLPSARANQFSGNAVTFLTVAKFTETN